MFKKNIKLVSLVSMLFLMTSCGHEFLNAEESKEAIDEIVSKVNDSNYEYPQELMFNIAYKNGENITKRDKYRISVPEKYYYESTSINEEDKKETWIYVDKGTLYKITLDSSNEERYWSIITSNFYEGNTTFNELFAQFASHINFFITYSKDTIYNYSSIIDDTYNKKVGESSIEVKSTFKYNLSINANYKDEKNLIVSSLIFNNALPTEISFLSKIENREISNYLCKFTYNTCNITKPQIEDEANFI